MKNSPSDVMKRIVSPFSKFYDKFLSIEAIKGMTRGFSNYVFTHGKDVATMMLFAFAASTLSSHLAQRNGLRKSDRENKDFLIQQENTELVLDLALTIIPPFLLKNFLNKKIVKGEMLTKADSNFIEGTMIPIVGTTSKNLFELPSKPTLKTRFKQTVNTVKTVMSENNLLAKDNLLRENNLLRETCLDNVKNKPLPLPQQTHLSMETATNLFDSTVYKYKKNYALMPDEKVRKAISAADNHLYRGSAFADICGEKEGILILSTLLYTIIAANVVMPILKNVIANKRYKQELAAKGETIESVKRKKRYTFFDTNIKVGDNNVFNKITKCDNKGNYIDKKIYNGLYSKPCKTGVFSTINSVNAMRF